MATYEGGSGRNPMRAAHLRQQFNSNVSQLILWGFLLNPPSENVYSCYFGRIGSVNVSHDLIIMQNGAT